MTKCCVDILCWAFENIFRMAFGMLEFQLDMIMNSSRFSIAFFKLPKNHSRIASFSEFTIPNSNGNMWLSSSNEATNSIMPLYLHINGYNWSTKRPLRYRGTETEEKVFEIAIIVNQKIRIRSWEIRTKVTICVTVRNKHSNSNKYTITKLKT